MIFLFLFTHEIDDEMLFAPTDIDVTITPQAVSEALTRCEFGLAINMALHLNEKQVLKLAIDNIELAAIELVVKSIDVRMMRDLLRFLAEEIVASVHIEFYLTWVSTILKQYGGVFEISSMPVMESLRSLIRAVSMHEAEVMKMCDENQYILSFLCSALSGDVCDVEGDE